MLLLLEVTSFLNLSALKMNKKEVIKQILYASAIKDLMCVQVCIRPDIAYMVIFLGRSNQIQR